MIIPPWRQLFVALIFGWTSAAGAAPTVTITPDKPAAIYATGDKITWQVTVAGIDPATLSGATYVLKKGGGTTIGQGTLTFNQGSATIETSLDTPGTILARVTVPVPNDKPVEALAGAAVSPEKIDRSAPCPDDFDTFWKAKLDELAAVPMNPVLTKGDSGVPGVDYYKVSLDNVRGTHVQGQLARPTQGDKFPAVLVVQWAGVYPLDKSWANNWAQAGWLVLNISAHDLPIDESAAFYKQQEDGPLKDYITQGLYDREKCYFLRMFLGDCRAADYLAGRPDWDGKTLVVTGGSQGGLQSFVTAGLVPRITAMMVQNPAGCDDTGALVGRLPAWPFYLMNPQGREQEMNTARYFDAVNFAARVKCPALVDLGLIDETAPPSGVFAAVHQLTGPKEVLALPNAHHTGDPDEVQAPYYKRVGAWSDALLHGTPLPVIPWTGASGG